MREQREIRFLRTKISTGHYHCLVFLFDPITGTFATTPGRAQKELERRCNEGVTGELVAEILYAGLAPEDYTAKNPRDIFTEKIPILTFLSVLDYAEESAQGLQEYLRLKAAHYFAVRDASDEFYNRIPPTDADVQTSADGMQRAPEGYYDDPDHY